MYDKETLITAESDISTIKLSQRQPMFTAMILQIVNASNTAQADGKEVDLTFVNDDGDVGE